MDYEDRLIIYIDILGFSSFVNYTSETRVNSSDKIMRINNLLNMIKKFFADDKIIISKSRQVTSFSDLIVVSISLSEIDNIDLEIAEFYYLLMNSFFKGFLLRGSIVYGKLVHTNNIIFGPGLIDAYNKERSIAKYPRIIIDEVIVSDLLDLETKSKLPKSCRDFISRDFDGLYYIDLFHSLREYVNSFWEYTQIIKSTCNILLDMIDNPTIKEKYIWLRDKFVAHINKHSKVLGYSFGGDDITKDDFETLKMMIYEFDEKETKKML